MGFAINTQEFRSRGKHEGRVTQRTRGKMRERCDNPPPLQKYKKRKKKRWKTTPAKLDSVAVFHLPQQIERMIAEHVPASYNEVQMHGVSSATHHHARWPWENYLSCGSSPAFSERWGDAAIEFSSRGREQYNSRRKLRLLPRLILK